MIYAHQELGHPVRPVRHAKIEAWLSQLEWCTLHRILKCTSTEIQAGVCSATTACSWFKRSVHGALGSAFATGKSQWIIKATEFDQPGDLARRSQA